MEQQIELLKEHILCYISNNVAVFTNLPLEYQTGDDWNDAPYEHNAGNPYEWRLSERNPLPKYELKYLHFEVEMQTPADIANGNSAYSVDDINIGSVAWLAQGRYSGIKQKPIMAGITIKEFKCLIWKNGGEILIAEPHEVCES